MRASTWRWVAELHCPSIAVARSAVLLLRAHCVSYSCALYDTRTQPVAKATRVRLSALRARACIAFARVASPQGPASRSMAESAAAAVLGASEAVPAGTPLVRGYEFPARGPAGTPPPPVDYQRLLECMATTGFQATAFGAAVTEVRRMLAWRLSDEPLPVPADGEEPPTAEELKQREQTRCKVRVAAQRSARLRRRAWPRADAADGSSRRSSWATPATWCPPACARASATWRNTRWWTSLSPQRAGWRRT